MNARARSPQAAFAAALLDAGGTLPPGLHTWNGSDPAARYAVYRNNVIVALTGALADTFPVTRALVGDDFFAAMARVYLVEHPPHTPVFAELGETFADWLAGFAPASALPYLPDVARLEHARVRAYHAPDTPPLPARRIGELLAQPEALPASRLRLHPSVTVLRSSFRVVSLWAAHQGGGCNEPVVVDGEEAAVVMREFDDAIVLPVPASTAVFIEQLLHGTAFGDAAAHAAAFDAAFDLAAALALLVGRHAIVAWLLAGDPP